MKTILISLGLTGLMISILLIGTATYLAEEEDMLLDDRSDSDF
jgi:hypothetical protein